MIHRYRNEDRARRERALEHMRRCRSTRPTETPAHPLTLSFERSEIRGLLWDYGAHLVAEATNYPGDVGYLEAHEILRNAIGDGRCKLPDHVRARLDGGKAVVR